MAQSVIFFGDFPTLIGADSTMTSYDPKIAPLIEDYHIFNQLSVAQYDLSIKTAFADFKVEEPVIQYSVERPCEIVKPTRAGEEDEDWTLYVRARRQRAPAVRIHGDVDSLRDYVHESIENYQELQPARAPDTYFSLKTDVVDDTHPPYTVDTRDYINHFVRACRRSPLPLRRVANVDNIMRAIRNQTRKDQTVEVIGKKRMTFQRKTRRVWRAQVLHLSGVKRERDCPSEEIIDRFIAACAQRQVPLVITYGNSGDIFRNGTSDIVIRGTSCTGFIDAREFVPYNLVAKITHFSENEPRKLQTRTSTSKIIQIALPEAHTCDQEHPWTLSNEFEGMLIDGIFRTTSPICSQCMQLSSQRDSHTIKTQMAVSPLMNTVHSDPKWKYIARVLTGLITEPALSGNDTELTNLSLELQKETDGQFKLLNAVVESICHALAGDFTAFENVHKPLKDLYNHLLKNQRLRNERPLSTFRNPYIPRALQYSQIIADGLIAHGDSEFWGSNTIHMQKLFNKYYDVFMDAHQIARQTQRKNPNGSRELASNMLFLEKDPVAFQGQLEAEVREQGPLGDHCISQIEGKIQHCTSCVTTDEGEPCTSFTIYPAVGCTRVDGEDTVRLPRTNPQICIAKEGLCYINIFMNMFMNVQGLSASILGNKIDQAVSALGLWPTVEDVAIVCAKMCTFFPAVCDTGLPRLLVDHAQNTVHVVDMLGSATTGYHILKAMTVKQFARLAHVSVKSKIKSYRVGGTKGNLTPEQQRFKLGLDNALKKTPSLGDRTKFIRDEFEALSALLKATTSAARFQHLLLEDPYLLLYAALSPCVLRAMAVSNSYQIAIRHFMTQEHSLMDIALVLKGMAEKQRLSKTIVQQLYYTRDDLSYIANQTADSSTLPSNHRVRTAHNLVNQLHQNLTANTQLIEQGFDRHFNWRGEQEKMLEEELENYIKELPCCAKLRYVLLRRKYIAMSRSRDAQKGENALCKTLKACTQTSLDITERTYAKIRATPAQLYMTCRHKVCTIVQRGFTNSLLTLIPSLPAHVGYGAMLATICATLGVLNRILYGYRQYKLAQRLKDEENMNELIAAKWVKSEYDIDDAQALQQFIAKLTKEDRKLGLYCKRLMGLEIDLQAKTNMQMNFEKIIALATLVMMYFDSMKSDVLYSTLTKLRTVFATLGQDTIVLQSEERTLIDSYLKGEPSDAASVHFKLRTDPVVSSSVVDTTFEEFWQRQLNLGRTTQHQRSIGNFVEFTRQNADQVIDKITASDQQEFTIRGPVGSGKSTALPYKLHRRGKTLVLEPTRPLAMNVWSQLNSETWSYTHSTLKMHAHVSLGTPLLNIMTTGYAFHYFANNASALSDFDYIMLDECHVADAHADAFVSLIRQCAVKAKVLYVSATPIGKEAEFTPPHPVQVVKVDNLGFQGFVNGLGTGCDSDATKYGCNILVYVASYNDVDSLTHLLTMRSFRVTPVDGRTMKKGESGISMNGTPGKPHFCVATNIIENGVTLDVDVVVDFGQKVVPHLDVDNRLITCAREAVTFGERIQRGGRVGRYKPGTVLKVGTTQAASVHVPELVATEAAFLCFAYDLPLMTVNVATGFLANCTRRQARTMASIELPIYVTKHLTHYDGTIHPAVLKVLQPYIKQTSKIITSHYAIPWNTVHSWKTAEEYKRISHIHDLPDDTRIPFLSSDIPAKVYNDLWQAVQRHRPIDCSVRLRSIPKQDIVITLQADPSSITRSLRHIDELLLAEQTKKHNLESAVSGGTFLQGAVEHLAAITRARYTTNDAQANINKLIQIRNELLTCQTFTTEELAGALSDRLTGLGVITLQSKEEIIQHLDLKHKYNGQRIVSDVLLGIGLLGGTCAMLLSVLRYYASDEFSLEDSETKTFREVLKEQYPEIELEGRNLNKRAKQKKAYQQARDRKTYGDDALDFTSGLRNYGERRAKGKKAPAGNKHRFVNMYGVSPEEYSLIRFLDPVTGYTIDAPLESVNLDAVNQEVRETRETLDQEVMLQPGAGYIPNALQAYAFNPDTRAALRIDLTPHNSDYLCNNGAISGFAAHDGELRQSGPHQNVPFSSVPAARPFDEVNLEAISTQRGLIDPTPIANHVIHLDAQYTEGEFEKCNSIRGIVFGAYTIAPSHCFKVKNPQLIFRTNHGIFRIPQGCEIETRQVNKLDMVIIKNPRDMPLFSTKLKFRQPVQGEQVFMLDVLHTNSEGRPLMSSTSIVYKSTPTMWVHNISTKTGQCGTPLVAVKDLAIVGIHTAASRLRQVNYFTCIPENFHSYIDEHMAWANDWVFDPSLIDWNGLQLANSQPLDRINPTRVMEALNLQSKESEHTWFTKEVAGNLKVVGTLPNSLITKHVIKGANQMFSLYLSNDEEARTFFEPLMGFYQPSRLNKQAFIKDIMKYSEITTVGVLDHNSFEKGFNSTLRILEHAGITECAYVTDTQEVVMSLNMDAATGVQYGGKKKEFFEGWNLDKFKEYHKESMQRLFDGKMGIWNGSLKAELRPIEKVQQNKTRVYAAAPVDVLLAAKTCVDDFNNQFYACHLEGPWTVGITKFRGGWDKFLRKFPDGWTYCHADGSRFDSSLTPFLINAVCLIRLKFMEEWDVGKRMLCNLYTQIAYTPIATPDGSVIKKFKGNNSGQPSTVVDNTLMVILAVEYAKHCLDVGDEDIVYFCNGDDLAIAIKPEREGKLDAFAEKFAQLGLNYDFSARTHNRGDISFMSHKGVVVDDQYFPKLSGERITAILEWKRTTEPEFELDALNAALIESHGYPQMEYHIRRYYSWLLEQAPYNHLAAIGRAPYISTPGLKNLYTGKGVAEEELEIYMSAQLALPPSDDVITLQADEKPVLSGLTAAPTNETEEAKKTRLAANKAKKVDFNKAADAWDAAHTDNKADRSQSTITAEETEATRESATDLGSGTHGGEVYKAPQLDVDKRIMRIPKVGGKSAINVKHLMGIKATSRDLSNSKATQAQFEFWYNECKKELGCSDDEFALIVDGLVVWCIHNGTTGTLSGEFKVMFDEVEATYPLRPFIQHASPTFRQIMMHFSDVAEAYIVKRNTVGKFMGKLAMKRNLLDYKYAQYAFDFYEMHDGTPALARDTIMHMKAAALRTSGQRTLGLDGNVSTTVQEVDHHTVADRPQIRN